jgi:hypothetical protein
LQFRKRLSGRFFCIQTLFLESSKYLFRAIDLGVMIFFLCPVRAREVVEIGTQELAYKTS